ncbi:MAG TPA: hypothetical protein VI700_03475 [Thermoanaerobaculaceae bacterium]|nr:hypothetical protein [Thermoanaerobaculaceae bacterium]
MATRRDSRTLLAPAIMAIAGLTACVTGPLQPREVPFPDVAVGAPHPRGVISSYEDALTSVLWVMENDLGFPPLTGSLRLYKDRTGLEAGLIGEGYEASYARQICDRLDGISRPGMILANDSKLRWERWPARIAFLAHEVTHVAEYALANGRRGSSDQWLREGLAEWVAWRVADALNLGSFAARKRALVLGLRQARDKHELLSFSELASQTAWVRTGNRRTTQAMYFQVFLAADLLIERHGLPSVLDYFRLFASSNDPGANFRAAFHEDRASFEATFEKNLDRLLD